MAAETPAAHEAIRGSFTGTSAAPAGGVAIESARGIAIAGCKDMPNVNRLLPRDEANRL
jgi:hypothetical protein